jgi:PST family polysaccharide transporter
MANDENLYLATFAVNLGYALFPSWFFQGVEKMAGMAIFNFIAKSIGALSVFIAFRERSDILIVPLSISLPNILVGVVAVLYVKRKYQFSFSFGSKDLLGPLIREGTPIFISTMLVTLYTTLNFVILGWFSSDLELGLFGGVYKIIMAIMMISQFPFNTSVFPFISRKTNLSSTGGILFFKRLVLVSFFFNALVSVVVYIFSEQIVLIVLGKDYQSAIGLLKIVSLLPLFVGVSSTLTIQGLYNFGLQRFNPYIGLTLAVICVSLNLIFIPQFGFKTAAWVWVFCQFLEIILVSVVLGLNRKMPFYWI